MATKYIERGTSFVGRESDTGDNVAPIFVNSSVEKLSVYDRTASVYRTVENGVLKTLTPTAAVALTSAQSGSVVFLNAAAGFAITLPTAAAGLNYTFVTGAAFATTNFTVVSPGGANIIFGGADVNSTWVPADAEDSINFVATAETVGDTIRVICDGTNWLVTGEVTAAGGVTFTAT